jgi:hypothetical protein
MKTDISGSYEHFQENENVGKMLNFINQYLKRKEVITPGRVFTNCSLTHSWS